MQYTVSDACQTHLPTGHRMHQSHLPVPTEVSPQDMNMVIWSLMELVKLAGLDGQAFDPDDPESYKVLLKAVRSTFVQGEIGKTLRSVSMVVRNSGSGWARIEDVDHTSVGGGAISVTTGGRLRTGFGFIAHKVVSLLACNDETFSAKGILIGGSVGVDYADWQLSMPFSCWVEKTGGAFAFGDIDAFFGPGTRTTIADLPDGSGFKITHGASDVGMVPTCVMMREGSGRPNAGVDCRPSYGVNEITVTCYDDFAGEISYNGTAWVVNTSNITKPVVNFAAGVLTVTHQDMGTDTKGLQVNALSGVNHAFQGTAITGTSFSVAFYTYAGAAINVANTDMKIRYFRPRKVPSKAPDAMRVAVSRGPVALHASDVVSASGNFWINGLMLEE